MKRTVKKLPSAAELAVMFGCSETEIALMPYQKKIRQFKRRNAICAHCREPAEPGKTLCAAHREMNLARVKKCQAARKEILERYRESRAVIGAPVR